MNQYQFKKIEQRMIRQFGKMKEAETDSCSMIAFCIESNLLVRARTMPDIKESDITNAYLLALHRVDQLLRGVEEDLSEFETDNIRVLENAVLMAFDPITNPEIQAALQLDMTNSAAVRSFYELPVKTILRTLQSVEFWNKNNGHHGYLRMLERDVAKLMKDEEMHFVVLVSHESETYSDLVKEEKG